uniref:Aspartyl/asparaginyl beta-hydroxylase n=1 Tax=Cacopsylla melanoneura TaxID=428564 RepID=A0A8D8QM80_9HEMI
MFKSAYQRSVHNVDRLTARPWWSLQETTYETFFRQLEKNWKKIRDEALAILKTKDQTVGFQDEAETLVQVGDWKQFDLFVRGRKVMVNCKRTPFTCRLVDEFPLAASCVRGQVKFSVIQPGTHVWPHCGPTNCRLRAHLGLVVAENATLRVGNETRLWEEGKVMIFDDSFEHEVWHNGSSYRLILIVDVWHPELTPYERKTLQPI